MQNLRLITPRPIFVGFLLAAVVLAVAFLRFSEQRRASARAQAERAWAENEEAVKQAITAKSSEGGYSITDFENACAFFLNLTGISIGRDIDFFGYHPNENTPHDLMLVQIWYTRNRDRLMMNGVAGRVEVRTPDDPAAAIWSNNEQVIIDLNRDRHLEAKSVENARRFFLSLTGIEVPPAVKHPSLGIVPADGTQEALQALRNWYELNGTDLCVVGQDSISICK